jgi:hypothetical protein
MRLTEQEQQEIVRFIEADKPLPEKYRFLLFEDKREVELVWNGKTNEVCNIVLPFQVIEQVDEPRAERSQEAGRQLTLFDLDARGRQLKGWTNKLIWNEWQSFRTRKDRSQELRSVFQNAGLGSGRLRSKWWTSLAMTQGPLWT